MIEFFDTHCHIHEIDASSGGVHEKWHSDGVDRTGGSVLQAAKTSGVTRLLVVGTTLRDSELAVKFAQAHDNVWASIGIHPHDAKDHMSTEVRQRFVALATQPKVVAIGECGLDYYYSLSPKEEQAAVLQFQMEIAKSHDLPLSFHIRDAFDDFWPLLESYKGLRGVLHSFTDTMAHLKRGLGYGLYIGVNGIATFTKSEEQRMISRTIPQQSILLETDAPFLTPKPFRGNICEPKHVVRTAEFLADLRGESLADLATATTANALSLLGL